MTSNPYGITEEQFDRAIELLRQGVTVRLAAAEVGAHSNGIQRMIRARGGREHLGIPEYDRSQSLPSASGVALCADRKPRQVLSDAEIARLYAGRLYGVGRVAA